MMSDSILIAYVAIRFRANTWAPSWRHIIEMANPDTAKVIFAPGQSGQLGSPHYSDLTSLFFEGKYITMHWSRDAVVAAAVRKLILQ